MSLTSAKIILDSIGEDAPRLTTFELVYPRIIHAELMTHRVFSRNASSSRAIPVDRMLQTVYETPAMPAEWRMEQSGMQGFAVAPQVVQDAAETIMWNAMRDAVRHARDLQSIGLHKQHVNRLTEPFQFIRVIITSSQFANWFGLRDHPAADPTIQRLAGLMREAYDASTPTFLNEGEWHLPYLTDEDKAAMSVYATSQDPAMEPLEVMKRCSAARCARVSYNNFKGLRPKIESDLSLYEKLVGSQPVHASPTEHQASPDIYLSKGRRTWRFPERQGNLTGWLQFRKFIPFENLEQVAS